MRFDLSNPIEAKSAQMRFKTLLESGKVISLTEKKKTRTLSQNAFIHVLINLFAIETGYTADEAKTHLKRECEFMRYQKGDEWFLKRTRDLKTDEISIFIDWIRNYSAQQGYYLPSSEEYLTNQTAIDKTISKHQKYL